MQCKKVGQDTEEGKQLLRGHEPRSMPAQNSIISPTHSCEQHRVPSSQPLQIWWWKEKQNTNKKQRSDLDSKPDGPTPNRPLQRP